ncbi:hypothetical protein CEXT_30551 [Caerostris extrusa]|uniref:Uncharacterized protein n=1 Tax=Caerostris extrusa TaxID=172846 RepID=A0AAV4MHK9_CAEEX|nr:hypothetical protein CEXT_30551 [Caerostris extrusa]
MEMAENMEYSRDCIINQDGKSSKPHQLTTSTAIAGSRHSRTLSSTLINSKTRAALPHPQTIEGIKVLAEMGKVWDHQKEDTK